MIRIFLCAAACLLALSTARSQGLLAIGPKSGTEGAWPWTASISSLVGWDSNPFATPKSSNGGNSSSDQGTFYMQNDVSLTYSSVDRINHLNLTVDYSNVWYADVPPGTDHFSNDWKISANYLRQETRRVTISDSLYLAHQTQPDFSVGLTLNRPTNGSLVGYNNLSLTYALSPALSVVTSYSLTGVQYDDDTFQGEDFVENLFSEQLRYLASRRSTLTFSLRYSILDYSHNPDASSKTFFVLTGIEHQFSRFLQGSLTAGAQFREYDGPLGSTSAPYVEASLNYNMGKNASWRWYASLGLNDTGSAGTQSGYSYSTGLSFQQKLAARLTLNIALSEQWVDYSKGTPALAPGFPPTAIDVPNLPTLSDNQQTFSGSVSLSYALWRNVSLTAGYSFTSVSGESVTVAAYDRHQVTLGLSATF
jgi:hypothetical protein